MSSFLFASNFRGHSCGLRVNTFFWCMRFTCHETLWLRAFFRLLFSYFFFWLSFQLFTKFLVLVVAGKVLVGLLKAHWAYISFFVNISWANLLTFGITIKQRSDNFISESQRRKAIVMKWNEKRVRKLRSSEIYGSFLGDFSFLARYYCPAYREYSSWAEEEKGSKNREEKVFHFSLWKLYNFHIKNLILRVALKLLQIISPHQFPAHRLPYIYTHTTISSLRSAINSNDAEKRAKLQMMEEEIHFNFPTHFSLLLLFRTPTRSDFDLIDVKKEKSRFWRDSVKLIYLLLFTIHFRFFTATFWAKFERKWGQETRKRKTFAEKEKVWQWKIKSEKHRRMKIKSFGPKKSLPIKPVCTTDSRHWSWARAWKISKFTSIVEKGRWRGQRTYFIFQSLHQLECCLPLCVLISLWYASTFSSSLVVRPVCARYFVLYCSWSGREESMKSLWLASHIPIDHNKCEGFFLFFSPMLCARLFLFIFFGNFRQQPVKIKDRMTHIRNFAR